MARRNQTIRFDGLEAKILEPIQPGVFQEAIKLESLRSQEEIKLDDFEDRVKSRQELKGYLKWLLILQNIAVFLLVFWALANQKIDGLQAVFSTLVGGTLLETASLVMVMVKWLFSDIPYDKKGK